MAYHAFVPTKLILLSLPPGFFTLCDRGYSRYKEKGVKRGKKGEKGTK
jgi:hypothetical protein